MFNYYIQGRILPERMDLLLNVPNPEKIELENFATFWISLYIDRSIISVEIESENEITDYATLRNYVKDHISELTDVMGYWNGWFYNIEIMSIAGKNNQPFIVFGTDIKKLAPNEENRPFTDPTKMMIFLHDHKYRFEIKESLSDLHLAIEHARDTGFFCYRAIESLRYCFNNVNSDDRSWKKFRECINISEPYMKYIMNYATKRRHGEHVGISGEKREELMQKTWIIITRFLVFLRNNEMPLDKNKFPEL